MLRGLSRLCQGLAGTAEVREGRVTTRPMLEELERREMPAIVLPAATLAITGLTQIYDLQSQTETFTGN